MCALWVAAADGSSPPWKLTAGMAADSDPRWAPDSASVFFLSDRTGSRQLCRVRVGGGEAEVLTDWRGEISDARPLADGRLVAVVAIDEPTEEDKRRRAERDDAFVWGQQLRSAGCGCLTWPPVSCVRWTASAAATSCSWRRGRTGARWRRSAGRIRRWIRA